MPLALADELLLITLDFQSGKRRLPDPTLGVGLSAALLCELVFSGAIVVADGRLGIGDYPPPTDQLAETLFEETRNSLYQQNVPLGDWIASHRGLVLNLVADRMINAGELRREQHKRLGRTSIRFFPQKPTDAFLRVQRISSYLRTRSEISAGDALLAGLVTMLRSSRPLLEIEDADQKYLDRLVPLLPQPLHEILDATESAVVTAARSPRF